LKISIVICTYNRGDILSITLPSLLSLVLPNNIHLEIIIVDNNSSDNTKFVTDKFISKTHQLNNDNLKASYVFEGNQGLSHARNKGYSESKGDYIAYIDDECILPEEWLNEAFKVIKNENPAFLGGPFLGKYMHGYSSAWYKESYGDSHMLQYKLPNGSLRNRYLSGGNLFIRRDVFEKIGVFDPKLGMIGNIINYGEEHDLQMRFIKSYPNEKVWYDENLFLWHIIRKEKMTLSFLFKDALIRGESAAELRDLPRKKLLHAPFYLLYFLAKAFFSGVFKAIKSIFVKDHYFSLLYEDYKYGTWRGIGSSIYKLKKLFSR